MSEIDQEKLRAELARHMPRKVRAFVGDDTREITVPPGRKRWQATLDLTASLPWTRIELLDRTGGLLAVVNAQLADEPAPAHAQDPDGARDERLLRLFHATRTRELEVAFQALTSIVGQLGTAVGALSQVYQLAIEQARENVPPPRIIMQAPPPPPEREEGLMSEEMLKQLLPIIVSKMLAAGVVAPPPAPTPSNGVKS